MDSSPPLVSIGMPVFNEARHLEEAIESLLGQDHANLELIISDNHSTDRTAAICLEYASRDPRIRYVENESNVGAVTNFNAVFRLSSGPYFMWAGGHDRWHPTFISRCLEVLESDPGVVLCHPQAGVIGGTGTKKSGIDTRGLDAFRRLRATLQGMAAYTIYGLIRSEALKTTRLFRNLWATDNMILLELALAGASAQINEPLYFERPIWAAGEAWKDEERYLAALDPKNSSRRVKLTASAALYGYAGIIRHSPFPQTQKLVLKWDMLRSVLGKYWRHILFHDFLCNLLRVPLGERRVCRFKKRVYALLGRVP